MRVGLGHDLHRLVAGRPLRLGGVIIESDFGPVAHSDGDALLHAVADALLGAAGEGDLGEHFPDADVRFRCADSRDLLRTVVARLHARGWSVVNVDAVVHLQRPRIAPYRAAMRRQIAGCLGVAEERINVKAKTGEHVDAVGAGLALACHAVVLVERSSS